MSYYNGTTYNLTWEQGRRLETVTRGSSVYYYTYNADGIRTSKIANGIKKEYILNGTQILAEIWSNDTIIIYIYDAEGAPVGMLYRDTLDDAGKFDVFWFERNLFGDVIAVYDSTGTVLIKYTYDAWGNVSTSYHNGATYNGATNNPFKYRGYYHDSETDFYYLNSRYYDPAICRFISTDAYSYLGAYGDFASYNLYAYCANNPVIYYDPSGHLLLTAIIIGAAAGLSVGFGITAYKDYKDDGEVFNGSIEVESYVANTLIVGAIGTTTGYVAPYVGGFFSGGFTAGSYALAGSGTLAASVAGTQLVGAAVATTSVVMFSKNAQRNQPKDTRSNKSQNKEIDYLQRKYGFNDAFRDRLHRRISKKGYNKQKIEQIIKDWLGF